MIKKEVREFDHFEIYVIRNPKWLEPHEREGFFLSPDFQIGSFELGRFKNHTEGNVEEIWDFFEKLMIENGFKDIKEE